MYFPYAYTDSQFQNVEVEPPSLATKIRASGRQFKNLLKGKKKASHSLEFIVSRTNTTKSRQIKTSQVGPILSRVPEEDELKTIPTTDNQSMNDPTSGLCIRFAEDRCVSPSLQIGSLVVEETSASRNQNVGPREYPKSFLPRLISL